MADSKYGRLFTEQEVKRIAAFAALEGAPSVATVIAELDAHPEHGTFTFPADEPLFLLRGQDKAAPRAIADDVDGEADYLRAARAAGASPEHLRAVEQAAHAMREWQAQHPGRVKVPD